MKNGFEFQEKFVQQLKTVVPSNLSLAEELADILEVSTDSIYRRMRCQSAFSFDEIAEIAKKFGISLDGLFNQHSTQVSFNFNPMFEENVNFDHYFKYFNHYLSELAKNENSKIIYAAEDIPVFRNFNYPNLSAFKSFYWRKVVLNMKSLADSKFNPEILKDEIVELNKNTYHIYTKINRYEIWTNETIDSTLNQVEYFWEAGIFLNPNQAILVLNEIRQMIDQLKMDCESGDEQSGSRNKFQLFSCDVFIGNNTVLIESGNSQINDKVFLGYNTFNSISTFNTALSKETRFWIENLMKKSVLISDSAEKLRAKFFNKLNSKISELEARILSIS